MICKSEIKRLAVQCGFELDERMDSLVDLLTNHIPDVGKMVAQVPVAWEPEFEGLGKQEDLVIKFCEEIAGKVGAIHCLPDPVRLLEMAQALYIAERDAIRD